MGVFENRTIHLPRARRRLIAMIGLLRVDLQHAREDLQNRVEMLEHAVAIARGYSQDSDPTELMNALFSLRGEVSVQCLDEVVNQAREVRVFRGEEPDQ